MEEHSFGYWLRLRRKALDLTLEGLADRVGCSVALIRKLESEERRPSVQIVERLAETFNIPIDERRDFLRFARGDLKSALVESDEDQPWRASTKSRRSNIPATTTSLIAREQEIARLREYLSDDVTRLVTLVGPPGIGKTRLSIEAARALIDDFPDGVFFVALALLDDPSLIPQTVAQSLGYVGPKNISINYQLKEGIGNKQMLIVLDNCEHLIEDVSSFTSDLLSACSRLKILATSRESLRIVGEWLYPVPAFEVPGESSSIDNTTLTKFPALTLFAERARAVRPDFKLDNENVKTVSTICAQLDGLPLAIELIAARMRLMTPEALLARLDKQFILSADGMRATSTRQKTLQNAIGWSYDLLSVEEQKLFAYLSVFSGSFTVDTAQAIFSRSFTGKPVRDLIASLLDKSLLQYVSEHKVRNEPRYTMLVTIQEFARGRLQQMGEELDIRNRHLAYFLDLTKDADKELRRPNQLEWLHRLGAEVNNLRAALDWAIETRQSELALQLVRKLHWFWFIRSDHSEGRHWLQRVLGMTDISLYPNEQAEALTQLAHQTWRQMGAREARPSVEHALSIARAHGDKWNTARALAILGLVLIDENNFDKAESTLKESMGFFQELNDKWGYAYTVGCLALGSLKRGALKTALDRFMQALILSREVGDPFFQSMALRHIGNLHIKQGELTRGVAALQEAAMLSRQLDSKYEIAQELWTFGRAAQASGKIAHAVRLFWASRNILDSIGAWPQAQKVESESDLAACRAALGETAFEEAMEQGRLMTMEQAIAYALENEE